MSKLSDLLLSLDACEEAVEDACEDAVEWAEAYDDLQAAWEACPRGDWMLWLLPHDLDGEEARAARLIACDMAERVLHLVPEGEDRPARAIEVARRYARGEATEEELLEARQGATYAANYSAYRASWSASAYASAYASADAYVYAYAANDAAIHAVDSVDSKDAERAAQADIVRRYWPTPPSSILRRVLGGKVER